MQLGVICPSVSGCGGTESVTQSGSQCGRRKDRQTVSQSGHDVIRWMDQTPTQGDNKTNSEIVGIISGGALSTHHKTPTIKSTTINCVCLR